MCSCVFINFFLLQLFEQGLHQYTWRTAESADFIETATALVCHELHTHLDTVQTNCHEIAMITLGWSTGASPLDVFAARVAGHTYTIDQLIEMQE